MSSAPTAKLLNGKGRVTLHECVRLEVRRLPRQSLVGWRRGIYPIYRCVSTGSERIFGCLDLRVGARQLAVLFPGVTLEDADDPRLDQADDEQAA